MTINHLPANEELAVEIDLGADRKLVTGLEYVETFGDALKDGMTHGSFGAGGGGVPEVRLCTASLDTSTEDGDCATFGYQWTTGQLTVTTNPPTKGMAVRLDPVTDNHDADDPDATTGASGRYGFSGVQDGTYDAIASSNADWTVVGDSAQRRWLYHDEFAEEKDEDKADSAWVGRRAQATATWKLTQEGLEVRGFVANVSHEHNNVVRGDETAPGMELEIKAYSGRNSTTTGQPIPTGKVLGTATVQSDGSYTFTDLSGGDYVIIAKNVAGKYEALQSGPTDNIGGAIAAQKYAKIEDEQMYSGKLPSWNYSKSTGVRVNTQSVSVKKVDGTTTTNRYNNFALLHADGTFSGRVVEARDDAGDVRVELRRCLTYTPDNATTTDVDEELCVEEVDYRPEGGFTTAAGNWEFSNLREGIYSVNADATGYLRAKRTAAGKIDDDAANCGPNSDKPGASTAATCDQYRTVAVIDSLKGQRAFNPGGQTFYVYSGSMSSLDVMTNLSIKGITAVGGDSTEMVTASDTAALKAHTQDDATGAFAMPVTNAAPVTYKAAAIVVKATVSSGAEYVVTRGTKVYKPTKTGGARVPLLATATPAAGGADVSAETVIQNALSVVVTAQNGYHDYGHTFTATRTNPAGNNLASQ